MIRNHTLGILILILVSVSVFVGGTNIYLLYRGSFEDYRQRLGQIAKTQAHLINAVARYDEKYGDKIHPEGATTATVNKIVAALKQYAGFGETGEILVARRLENRIMYIYSQRKPVEDLGLVPMNSENAAPMKAALQGSNGIMRGPDYNGTEVLAAYQHIPLLSFGLVVKVNVEEIRRPFIRTAMISSGVAAVAIAIGTILFFYFGQPLVRKLQRYSEELEEEVQDRTESLKIANEALADEVKFRKKAEGAKDEFVSTVSHELRTPLTAIIGSMGLLKGGVAGALSEKANRMIEIAHNNGNRLLRLINNILDIQKMEAGKIELHREKLNLVELLKQSVESNEQFAGKYEVGLEFNNAATEQINVDADSDKIIQALTNLISNAVKYSPKGDTVNVDLSLDNDLAKVEVKDNGAGIPDEFKDKIFQKFSQADTSTTKKVGGTGLGLSITKAIIEMHGGYINFESELNKGTNFYFTLPVLKE